MDVDSVLEAFLFRGLSNAILFTKWITELLLTSVTDATFLYHEANKSINMFGDDDDFVFHSFYFALRVKHKDYYHCTHHSCRLDLAEDATMCIKVLFSKNISNWGEFSICR